MNRLFKLAVAALVSLWVGLAAASSATALPAATTPGVTGATLVGVPEVGSVLYYTNVPPGSVCQVYRDGAAVSGATSCLSYTVVTADIGHSITATVGRGIVAALTISNPPPASATVGTAYSYTGPTVAGGSGGNVFGRLGSYPPGLSFTSSNGALSGTPTTSGVYSGLTIAVSDSVGGAASLATFTITVTAAGGSNPGKLDLSNPASVTGLLTVF